MVHKLMIVGTRGAPSSLRAIVFDYDDTLADTLAARAVALRRTFEAVGITTDADAYLAATRGIPFQVSFQAYDGGRWKGLHMMEAYRTAYWAKERGLVGLFDGVAALLDHLRALNVRMGIVTSKARDIVVAGRAAGTLVELDELSLSWLAPYTIGFEDVREHKPHPEGLERLLATLGVRPEETLVVGDSFADIQLAQNAGCWSCLAGWGVPVEERQPAAATPDLIAEHPLAILQLFSQGAGAPSD